jgi:5-methylcytosine-specific restriction enzyme subunit McrC
VADLFAQVLVRGVNHLMRRGLEQSYRELNDEIAGIRGRIDIVGSARRLQLAHGRATCAFDELTVDSAANRIVKGTLRFLGRVPALDPVLQRDIRELLRRLSWVSDIQLTGRLLRSIQIHGNNRFYQFLLNVCEFVRNLWLVDEASGDYSFRDFTRDDRAMARVFEHFVFNFYRLERPDIAVKEERITWDASSDSDPKLSYLPQMRTDVSIVLPGTHLIIDTKYYSEALSYYRESESVRSQHLYQIFAYLMNAKTPHGRRLEGMLLYPQVEKKLRLAYEIHGKRIRVCTVDLAQDWRLIREELLGLLPAG